MEYLTLLKSNFKRHKGSVIGIFILVLIVAISLTTVLSIWKNSNSYLNQEIDRLGFGEVTAWVSTTQGIENLAQEITAINEVERVNVQNITYSNYTINDISSDSEGQLIAYNATSYPYKIFTDNLSGYKEEPTEIKAGEIYLSPSLASAFQVQIGSEIQFSITRQGDKKAFIVKGYFEDPFMGSSMIGMKSFLISQLDKEEIQQQVQGAGIDAIARNGAMVHIFKAKESTISSGEFSSIINKQTSLPQYAEFAHSKATILGFMLLLQNIFTGVLVAFVVVLTLVAMVVLSHNINSTIDEDRVNMGVLKTLGYTGKNLQGVQLIQYAIVALTAILFGLFSSIWLIDIVLSMTILTTGMSIPNGISLGLSGLSCIVVFLILMGFVYFKTIRIGKITPLEAISKGSATSQTKKPTLFKIQKNCLGLWLAVRQLTWGIRQYISACIVAVLLVFFASLIGRLDFWIGTNGEGLMDAFNPAEHHMAVQIIGEYETAEIEAEIYKYTQITDRYELAMPSVVVNGVDYTANVISEPQRFNILQGRTSTQDNEIVITEFVAADLNLKIGDTITASATKGSNEYIITGIYQCANDMGKNIGMSKEGYLKIGEDSKNIWCNHYFLQDQSQKQIILQSLDTTYKTGVYMHENSWSGLYSIITAIKLLIVAMYVIVTVFILIVVTLTGKKILSTEQKDLGIYKTLGFLSNGLRCTFAARFGIVALIGSTAGAILSAILTDSIMSFILKIGGISNFTSNPSIATVLLPVMAVTSLFIVAGYLVSKRIKVVSLVALIAE